MLWSIGFAVVALIVVIYAVNIYNKLLRLRVQGKNGFEQIDIQLRRRYDLIPMLVETAKGAMAHERETLEAVITARNQAASALAAAEKNPGGAEQMQALAAHEGALGGALGRLFAVMEAYPDLKANQNMMQLSEELTSTENKVAFSRQAYNDAVTRYNIARKSFPAIAIAGMVGHGSDMEFLEIPDQAEIQQPPQVSFSS